MLDSSLHGERATDGRGRRFLAEVRPGDAVLVGQAAGFRWTGPSGGRSFVDQAAITGESSPVEKLPALRSMQERSIRPARSRSAERLGRDTSYGKIIEAVESAERSRAPVQKVADRYAGYLVYFALGCAALTFVITRDARSTIAVIIVAGACGIAAGTPLAVLGAIGRARAKAHHQRRRYLEKLGDVDIVLFDKTGTVTVRARPEIEDLTTCRRGQNEALLEAAAIAEVRSEHPLAKAILRERQN